ncbi:MAG: hypothetical protein ACP5IL_00885, partial [Syntrophobacteraceae bacterium]
LRIVFLSSPFFRAFAPSREPKSTTLSPAGGEVLLDPNTFGLVLDSQNSVTPAISWWHKENLTHAFGRLRYHGT